jgi:3-oxoadipate enol-lactonase
MLRKTGMAEVNGARIYYEVAGEGDPLVLVHAGIADSRMWEDQLIVFADRYRIIRHDMRGFGMTAMVEGPFSHYEDLRALLDSRRRAGAPRGVFDGGWRRARLRARVPAEGR